MINTAVCLIKINCPFLKQVVYFTIHMSYHTYDTGTWQRLFSPNKLLGIHFGNSSFLDSFRDFQEWFQVIIWVFMPIFGIHSARYFLAFVYNYTCQGKEKLRIMYFSNENHWTRISNVECCITPKKASDHEEADTKLVSLKSIMPTYRLVRVS